MDIGIDQKPLECHLGKWEQRNNILHISIDNCHNIMESLVNDHIQLIYSHETVALPQDVVWMLHLPLEQQLNQALQLNSNGWSW